MDGYYAPHYYWLLSYLTAKRAHYHPFFKARVPAAFEGSGGLYALLAWRPRPPTLIFRRPHPSALHRTRPAHALEALPFALCL
jgi:hypothetical protein